MSHKLHRLLGSMWNTPHLITAAALRPIIEYLQVRNSPNFSFLPDEDSEAMEKDDDDNQVVINGIGEIKISGAISYLPVDGVCGPVGSSYTGILDDAEDLIEAGATTIILTFASPGGAAAHCFTTCEALREMADEAGVKLVSYIDEQAASAALALSVISDEVYIHPSASTGSIGCVVVLIDQSKALADAGLKPIYISSTPGKTPFDDDGSFSKGFLESLQEDVTRLGLQFAEHVSKYTGLAVDDIVAMDAKMFHAEAALEVGLVNGVMDHKQFTAYIAGMNKGNK